MRKPYKYISDVSDEDIEFLEKLMKSKSPFRIRRKAHVILMSFRKFCIDKIAEAYELKRDTVSKYIDDWKKYGRDGLADRKKSGRPPKLNASGIETAKKIIGKSPQSPRKIIAEISRKTGITVSLQTLRRIVKKLDMRWKRVRKSVKNKRNEQDFRESETEIRNMIMQHKSGKIDLFFYDETGFSTGSHVPYAYQPVGKTLEISATCRKRLNVIGFFSPDNKLTPFCFECSVNSDVVTACFDRFAEDIDKNKKTFVIADNSPVHHSDDFYEKIPEWEKKGLFIKYLPVYSPELNRIEILWKSIKYRWLDISSYTSFKNLVKNVENVLKNVGKKYFIEFS